MYAEQFDTFTILLLTSNIDSIECTNEPLRQTIQISSARDVLLHLTTIFHLVLILHNDLGPLLLFLITRRKLH